MNALDFSAWINEQDKMITENAFRDFSKSDRSKDLDFILLTQIFRRIPYIFQNKIQLFTRIVLMAQQKLDLMPNSLYVTGSANFGFSLTPQPHKWLRSFSDTSDIDWFIVSESLFSRLEQDIELFRKTNPTHRNHSTVSSQLKKGFIDVKQIPLNKGFTCVDQCSMVAFLIREELKRDHDLRYCRSGHFRVYKNYSTAVSQICLNLRLARDFAKKLQS